MFELPSYKYSSVIVPSQILLSLFWYIFFNKILIDSSIANIFFFFFFFYYRLIGLVGRVFANGSGDLGSIPGRVMPKTLKMVLDTSLLNTQQYKVRIKGKVVQSRERSSVLLYASV